MMDKLQDLGRSEVMKILDYIRVCEIYGVNPLTYGIDIEINKEQAIERFKYNSCEFDGKVKLKDYSYILNKELKEVSLMHLEGDFNALDIYIIGACHIPFMSKFSNKTIILDTILFSKKTLNVYYASSEINLIK